MTEYSKEDLQRVIDESFGGSEKAYYAAAAESTREIINWQDLVAANTVLPHLAEDGLTLVEYYLGYIPDYYDTYPQEAFIRALVQQYLGGTISQKELFEQAEIHVRHMRNDTMKSHLQEGFDFATYQLYSTHYPQFRDAVASRLAKFLGYEPNLEHSLKVELLLREYMADDRCYFPDDDMNDLDIQSLSIIKYREILISKGKVAADNSNFFVSEFLNTV